MSSPNKTVAAARRKMGGFPAHPAQPQSAFMQWFFDQVQTHGRKDFASLEDALKEFNTTTGEKA